MSVINRQPGQARDPVLRSVLDGETQGQRGCADDPSNLHTHHFPTAVTSEFEFGVGGEDPGPSPETVAVARPICDSLELGINP